MQTLVNGNIDTTNFASGFLFSGTDSGWVPLSLASTPGAGWGTNSPTNYAPAYRAVGGLVFLRGVAFNNTGGPSGSPFVTPLPTAMRPSVSVVITVPGIAGVFTILPNGTTSASGTAGTGNAAYFDGLFYSL